MSSLFGQSGLKGATGSSAGNRIPSGYRQGQIANYSPEQMDLFKSLFGQVGPDSYLSKLAGGDQETFNQIEAPALRQFGALQGNIASRFSGGGTFGSRRSSGFQNTMAGESSDFAQQLQSQRQGLQRQALQDLMGISDSLLNQRPYQTFLTPKKKSFLQELLGGLAGGVGQGIGTFGSLAAFG